MGIADGSVDGKIDIDGEAVGSIDTVGTLVGHTVGIEVGIAEG